MGRTPGLPNRSLLATLSHFVSDEQLLSSISMLSIFHVRPPSSEVGVDALAFWKEAVLPQFGTLEVRVISVWTYEWAGMTPLAPHWHSVFGQNCHGASWVMLEIWVPTEACCQIRFWPLSSLGLYQNSRLMPLFASQKSVVVFAQNGEDDSRHFVHGFGRHRVLYWVRVTVVQTGERAPLIRLLVLYATESAPILHRVLFSLILEYLRMHSIQVGKPRSGFDMFHP